MFWPLLDLQSLEDGSMLLESLEIAGLLLGAAAALLIAMVVAELIVAVRRKDHSLPAILQLGGTIPRL